MKNIVSLMISAAIAASGFCAVNISAEDISSFETTVNMDINGDKKFNSIDIIVAKNQMLGKCLVSDINFVDVNGDGIFNILDFIAMKEKLITGTEDSVYYNSYWEDSVICYENLKAKGTAEDNNPITYSKEELLKYIDYSSVLNRNTPLTYLNEQFPIEKLITPENAMPYCIYPLDTGEKMYVFIEEKIESMRLVTAVFIVDKMLDAEDFNSLDKGMNLTDVEKIDAGTKYMDSVRNFPLYEKHTLHMVKDGFVKITYNVDETENTFVRHQPVPNNPEEFIIDKIEFIPNGDIISLYFQEDYHDFRIQVLDK